MINYLKKKSLKDIVITGGEPILHDEIGEILEFSTNLNMNIFLHTNGEDHDLLLKNLINRRIHVVISPKRILNNETIEKQIVLLKKLIKNRKIKVSYNILEPLCYNFDLIAKIFLKCGAIAVNLLTIKPCIDDVKENDFDSTKSKNSDCPAGIKWVNLDFDNSIGKYILYGCGYVAYSKEKKLNPNYIAGSFDYQNLATMEFIWSDESKWNIFRSSEPGSCIYEKIVS